MKLRVIFLEKSKIFYTLILIFILLLILLVILILNKKENTDTNEVFSIIEDRKAIKADFTGDGEDDILYIKTEKDKYYIQINSNNNSYYLEPSRELSTVGHYYSYSPMKVSFNDINGDKIPEIFIQSSQKNNTIQHIFTWNGYDFKDIYCSNNNFFGLAETKDKFLKVYSGNINPPNTNFSTYIFNGQSMEKINYQRDLPGESIITSIINYVERLPNSRNNLSKEVFDKNFSPEILEDLLKTYDFDNNYTLQDALFKETGYDSSSNPISVIWTLNFKVMNLNYNKSDNISLIVNLERDNCNHSNCFYVHSLSSVIQK